MSPRARDPYARPSGTRPASRNHRVGRRQRLADPMRRMRVGLAVVVILLTVIGGRLVQLQGLDGAKYASAAEELRLTSIDLPAARGQILDRNGTALAWSAQAKAVFADPVMIVSVQRTALALAPLLDMTADGLIPLLSDDGTRFVYLARRIDPAVAQAITDLELPGIGTLDEQSRQYPGTSTAAQVVGFVNADSQGLAGVEQQYDDVLTGRPGELVYEQGRFGLPIPAATRDFTAAVPGSDVRLSLDQDLQFVLEQAVATALQDDTVSTAMAVALDVQTGQVLAMGGAPGYDSASPGDVDGALLANPTVSNVIEPGSVNKMVTFAAMLDRGLITPRDTMVVPDHIRVADKQINDAWGHDPIDFTTTGVLAKSSNVGTIMLAERLGAPVLEEYLHRFGLGSPTGIDLPAESRGILAPRAEWSGSQYGTIPIGQGISMTVLQMASMYQAVANDGVLIPPRIVTDVVAPDGTSTSPDAAPRRRVISSAAAAQLRYMLEAVTSEEGTAPLARIDGYRVAGKTGTAQRPNPECRCYDGGGYWATFSGFAPADAPRFVVAVSVEQPTGGGHGGAIAAPVFTTIMSHALREFGVIPSGTTEPHFQLTAPAPTGADGD